MSRDRREFTSMKRGMSPAAQVQVPGIVSFLLDRRSHASSGSSHRVSKRGRNDTQGNPKMAAPLRTPENSPTQRPVEIPTPDEVKALLRACSGRS